MVGLSGGAQGDSEGEAGGGAGNAHGEGDSGGGGLSDSGGGGQVLGDHLIGQSQDPGPLLILPEGRSATSRVSLVH